MSIGNVKCVAVEVMAGAALSAAFCGCATASPENGSFRIMSYNIRHGEGMDGVIDCRNAGRVIAVESPRFVGLQEVDMRTRRVKGVDSCAIIEEATGLHATFAKAMEFSGGEYGNAVLSREPPHGVKRIPLPGAEPRVLLLCEFDDCWFGTMHLAVDSERARADSVEIIRRAIAECGDKPVFISGDWNARPDSSVLKALKGFMTVLSGEDEATFNDGKPDDVRRPNHGNCIDYIAIDSAARESFAVSARRVIRDRMTSDHMPVVVDVSPAGK